jgi:hypothetical protein
VSSECEEEDWNFEATENVTHNTNGQESETGETVYRIVTSSKKQMTCKITLPTQIHFLLQNHLLSELSSIQVNTIKLNVKVKWLMPLSHT